MSVRPHVAAALAGAHGVVIGLNSVCDLHKQIPEQLPREIFDYMFDRGERFSIPEMLSDLGTMVQLAIDRGSGEMAIERWAAAERQAAPAAGLKPGLSDVLDACRATRRSVAVVSSNATGVVEQVLERHGLRAKVIGREGAEVPFPLDAATRLGLHPDQVALISDRYHALYWAKEDGMRRIGFEGYDKRSRLASYGPVLRNLFRLAEAIHAVPVATKH